MHGQWQGFCAVAPGSEGCQIALMNKHVLVLNAGSSSLKFCVYRLAGKASWQVESRGQIEGIGTAPRLTVKDAKGEKRTVWEYFHQAVALTWISGEISGFSRAASGHCYFILKDDRAQVRCVLFRNKAQLQDVALKDGLAVEVRATPTIANCCCCSVSRNP